MESQTKRKISVQNGRRISNALSPSRCPCSFSRLSRKPTENAQGKIAKETPRKRTRKNRQGNWNKQVNNYITSEGLYCESYVLKRRQLLAVSVVARLMHLTSTSDWNHLDYFVWTILEREVNNTMHALKEAINDAMSDIEAVAKACSNFPSYLENVVTAGTE